LLACALANAVWAQDPVVFLNHFYTTVSPETYQAIAESPFLKTLFAPFETRTTVRRDQTYTGAYFYGRDTYFEFFSAGGERKLGDTGVALGVEQKGGSQRVADRWAPVEVMTITRQAEGRDLPWFISTAVEAPRGRPFRLWAMEYVTTFLAQWYPQFAPAKPDSIARADILTRYVAKIGQLDTRNQTLLENVTVLDLTLDADQRAATREALKGVGWKVSAAGVRDTCAGPGITVHLSTGPRVKLNRVDFRLRRPHQVKSYRLGDSTLSFNDKLTASWQF
jgi:hypothetical protein